MSTPTSSRTPVRSAACSIVEQLEGRSLHSATLLSNGTLSIVEGNGSDTVKVEYRSDGTMFVRENGRNLNFKSSPIRRINFAGNGGHDSLWVANNVRVVVEAYGGSGNDTLRGHSGVDRFWGDSGNDIIKGFAGDDILDGGSLGADAYSGDNDRIYGGDGDDTIRGAEDGTLVEGYGDSGNDEIVGGNRADKLDGGSDDDRVFGMGGNDLVSGGYGNDRVHGDDGDDRTWGRMEGNDTLEGNAGNDYIRDIFGTDIITDHFGYNVIDVADTAGPGNIDTIWVFYGTAGNNIRMNPWDQLNPGWTPMGVTS